MIISSGFPTRFVTNESKGMVHEHNSTLIEVMELSKANKKLKAHKYKSSFHLELRDFTSK